MSQPFSSLPYRHPPADTVLSVYHGPLLVYTDRTVNGFVARHLFGGPNHVESGFESGTASGGAVIWWLTSRHEATTDVSGQGGLHSTREALMATLDTIVSLIDSAKQLKAIAEESGNVEIKARVLDVIVQLQEIREQVITGGHPPRELASGTDTPPPSSVEIPVTVSQDWGEAVAQPARLEPSGEIETYSLVADSATPESEASDADSSPEAAEAASAEETGKKSKSGTKKKKSETESKADSNGEPAPEADLSPEEKVALAEQRIAALEPLHRAALKKINDALTPEQAARKVAATKKGLASGLKGKALQEAVVKALGLTEEQEKIISEGKQDLHKVRLAIGHQVKGLLSKEQLERMLRSHRH